MKSIFMKLCDEAHDSEHIEVISMHGWRETVRYFCGCEVESVRPRERDDRGLRTDP